MLAIVLHSVFFCAVFNRQNVFWLQFRYSGQRTEQVIVSRSFRLSTLGCKLCTFVSREHTGVVPEHSQFSLCIICGDNSSNTCRLFSRKYFVDYRRNIRKDFIREILRKKGKYHERDQLKPKILQEYGGGSSRHKEILKSGLWSKRG